MSTEQQHYSTETERRLTALETFRADSERMHTEQRVFMEKFEGVPAAIETLNKTMQQIALQLESLKPVQILVYGFVGTVMLAFVGALTVLVIK